MAEVLIVGCGTIGVLCGNRLVAQGHDVQGLRRQPHPDAGAHFPIHAGDAADSAAFAALKRPPTAILLCANPGLRRGRDNGLRQAARMLVAYFPASRLVYTGTTAVYADAQGHGVDEAAAVDTSTASLRALLEIEAAVRAQADSLILRVTALVGPTRTHARDRILAGERSISGDVGRPFSWLHEEDCAEVCARAVLGALGTGLLNAAAPSWITLGEYYRRLGRQVGCEVTMTGDATPHPARWIDAGRLHALMPEYPWQEP